MVSLGLKNLFTRRIYYLRIVGLIFCGMLFAQVAESVEVIAHPSVGTNTLTLSAARSIFGLRQNKWPDGSMVQVFVLADSHPTHVALCKERLNLYPYQLRQSWDRLVYAGMAQAPTQVGSEQELIQKVATTPGAVGYAWKVKPNDSIKIIVLQ